MNVHSFLHVPFEGLGRLGSWLELRGHALTSTHWHEGGRAPDVEAYDWLVVMGGPMSVHQHRDHPWLVEEKRAIREAIDAGRRVLGVCLGAQLIADVLGAKVVQNPHREIGWFPVKPVATPAESPLALDRETVVFHWHGDTFSLPPRAVLLASSAACAHQAFAYGSRVLALQFHIEMAGPELAQITEACADELRPGPFVQNAAQILQGADVHAGGAAALLRRWMTLLERDQP